MVVGDDRPFVGALITLDPEALEQWKEANGRRDATLAELATDPAILAEMQKAVDEANRMVSKAEQIKKFIVLDTDSPRRPGTSRRA